MIEISEITAAKAYEYAHSDALFIDVREKEEVELVSYDVLNVLNIPLSVFDDNFLELPKDKTMIVVCNMGGKSLKAAQFLVVNGWDSKLVYNLTGGIVAWEQAQLPVKRKPRTFEMAKPKSSCGCKNSSCC